jgi:hypothetical protein
MPILKLAFYAGLVLFGAVGMYICAVFFLTSGFGGPISISYPQNGRVINETITRAGDASRHFQMQMLMGYGPGLLGALALWFGLRWFKR